MGSRELLEELLQGAVSDREADARAALALLYQYDSAHGGDLVKTLATYLALGCNASKCADALYLHRSGLLYRLGRIEDLLGVRLNEFEDRVALEIAILAIPSASVRT